MAFLGIYKKKSAHLLFGARSLLLVHVHFTRLGIRGVYEDLFIMDEGDPP